MTETTLKSCVRLAVKKNYPDAFIWKIHDAFTAGIPDLLIIIKGVHIFIELKAGSPVSKIQEWTLSKIKEAGGHAYVCRSVKDALDVIRCALEIENKDLVTV